MAVILITAFGLAIWGRFDPRVRTFVTGGEQLETIVVEEPCPDTEYWKAEYFKLKKEWEEFCSQGNHVCGG